MLAGFLGRGARTSGLQLSVRDLFLFSRPPNALSGRHLCAPGFPPQRHWQSSDAPLHRVGPGAWLRADGVDLSGLEYESASHLQTVGRTPNERVVLVSTDT